MTQNSHLVGQHIISLNVSGGYLDQLDLGFTPHLNCIIGARGSGKTTVLEFIRYALNQLPEDGSAARRIETLVEQNLDGGHIAIEFQTKDGLKYCVRRTAGEAPVILDSNGSPTDIDIAGHGFFHASIFSQNEVEGIADSPDSQLALIDTFEAEKISEIDVCISQIETDLRANAGTLLPLHESIGRLTEELQTRKGIEDRLKTFASNAGSNAESINSGHAAKALRDREKRAIANTAQGLNETVRKVDEFKSQIQAQVRSHLGDDILSGANEKIFADISTQLEHFCQNANSYLDKLSESARVVQQRLAAESKKLGLIHGQQDLGFQKLLEKHKEAQGQATERVRLEKQHNDLLAKDRLKRTHQDTLEKRLQERTDLLSRLSELRDQRYSLRKAITERITKSLNGTIRASVVQYGDRTKYRDSLGLALKDARLRTIQVSEKLANALGPVELIDAVKNRNSDALVQAAGLNPDQAEKVVQSLSNTECLYELEAIELQDQPKIELLDGDVYKDSLSLSTGQKCTAILPILLLDSESPLLIDQPEDNLDNGYIFKIVEESISKVKARRQLIFNTHNANLPILGEAERVIVLKSDGTGSTLEKSGSIDHCKKEIVNLLEGGKEAFKRRQQRYSY